MPLFTSKFSFKKSTPRTANEAGRRRPRSRKNEPTDSETEEDEESRTSEEEEEDIEEEERSSSSLTKDDIHKEDKGKRDDKQLPKQKAGKDKTKTKKEMKTPTTDMVLCLDKPQGLVFQFEPKQGVWTSLGIRSKKESIVLSPSSPLPPPSKAQNIAEPVGQSQQNEQMVQKIKDLEEENRLLKLKIEILMEMVRRRQLFDC